MQELRGVNVLEKSPSGCSGCHFFNTRDPQSQYFPGLSDKPAEGLSERQRKNWELAAREFAEGRTALTARPLRYYVDFGFMCNLSCIQCHQVPRREKNRREVDSDVLFSWKEDFLSGLEVVVIGGEPFVLPEALKFIRAFTEDGDLEDVNLHICTNGTLHHKHMRTLAKKRKLSLAVSIDSIEDAYEAIRVDGSWDLVERNILDFIRYGKENGLDWHVSTRCAMMKRGIEKLPRLARWHVEHEISTWFFELISARGVEKAVAEQNVLADPTVLRDMPGWDRYLDEAADIFEAGGMTEPATTLRFYKAKISSKLEALSLNPLPATVVRANDWIPIINEDVEGLTRTLQASIYTPEAAGPFVVVANGIARFRSTSLRDHVATDFQDLPHRPDEDLWIKFACEWPQNASEGERCLIHLQDQSWLMTWPSDFVEAQESPNFVVRYVKVPPTSRRIRVLIYGNDDSASIGILPKRMTLELRSGMPARAAVFQA